VWAAHGVTASFRHPPDPAWGLFHGLQVEICSTVDLPGLQGHSLPHHGLLHGLQGNLCSGISSTSSPSFTNLSVCGVLTPLCGYKKVLHGVFLLLNCVIPEALPPLLMGSALASGGSVLEPAGIGSILHGGNFWQLLTEATPVAPCYQNLAVLQGPNAASVQETRAILPARLAALHPQLLLSRVLGPAVRLLAEGQAPGLTDYELP